MTKIKYVEMADKEFWFTLDRHLPEMEGNFWNIGKKT